MTLPTRKLLQTKKAPQLEAAGPSGEWRLLVVALILLLGLHRICGDHRARRVGRLIDVRLTRAERRIRSSRTLVSALDLGGLRGIHVGGDMVLVGVCSLDLGLRERCDAVLVEPARDGRAQVLVPRDAALVVGAHDERLVAIDVDELPAVVLVDRLVHLDELAAGEADDTARLVAVQDDLTVLLLQRDADALGDEVAEDGANEQQCLQRVDDAFHREMEVSGHEVGRCRSPHHCVEDDSCDADRRAGRGVARTLGDVVLALVAGDPRFDERVERHDHDEQPEHSDGDQDAQRQGVVQEHDVQVRRCETQRAVGESDVPVRLGSGRDRRRVVRTVVPDRVDLEERGYQHDRTEDDEQEAAHLRHVHRHHRVAHDVVVRAAGAGELRVLVDDHQHQVQHEQADQQQRQQQDMEGVKTADDVGAGELAAEEQERGPRADQGETLDHAVDDAQAVAREQVVRQRVAGEALGHGEDEQHEADHPVELARLAERTGEEDAEHVDADTGHEDERRPVVDLPHEEATAQIERDVQCRLECCRHLDAAHRSVGTGVVRLDHRRVEEERQEGSGQEHDHEAPQRDLAEHERPVVGEDLATQLLDEAGEAGALIDVVRRGADEAAAERGLVVLVLFGQRCGAQWRSQKLGPTGSVKSLRATRYPSSSTMIGSCGSGRAAGPKMTLAWSVTSNCD